MADASPPEDAQISKTDEKKPTTRRRRRAVSFDGAGFELRGGEDCGSCDSKVYVTDDGGLIIAPSRKRGGSSKGKSSASSPTTKPPAGEGSRTHSHDTKRASSQGRHTTKSIDQVVATPSTVSSPRMKISPLSNEHSLVLHREKKSRGAIWRERLRNPLNIFCAAVLVGTCISLWRTPIDPTDYAERTRHVLKDTPLIDGHNDLPWQLRVEVHNQIYNGHVNLSNRLHGHTDLKRMKQGLVGGQFWSVYVECDDRQQRFDDPSWLPRDTLEQIDVARRFIEHYSDDLEFCDTSKCAANAFKAGRIASMIGIEGGHQVGNSIATLRQMYHLGARYLTLTHDCDNAFATAAKTVEEGAEDKGLSSLGKKLVEEMNRLGMMIDLSHVSHQTMRDVLGTSRAPVIFSHSGAYTTEAHVRNVPDDVLRSLRHNGGVVMAAFPSRLLNRVNPGDATTEDVVDHITHIAEICGWSCVGIGSDFSGTRHLPRGLGDVSKFPYLFHALMERGAGDNLVRLVAGRNILRAWSSVEDKSKEIQAEGARPVEQEFEQRWWPQGREDSPWILRRPRRTGAPKQGATVQVD
ncbi:hypothetical protein S40293_02264 [Stachybotrys chartarum IBT 40293]|nr:hypothetical protein S40293_02264 [Stachybotrys chartarum IBT 40293]